jgi:hypothetical protein
MDEPKVTFPNLKPTLGMDELRYDWNVCDLSYTLDGFHEKYREYGARDAERFVRHLTVPLLTGEDLLSIIDQFPDIGASDKAPIIYDNHTTGNTVIAVQPEHADDLEKGGRTVYSILLFSISPTSFTAFGSEKAHAEGLLVSGHSVPIYKIRHKGMWVYEHFLPVTIVSPFKEYCFEDKDPLVRVTVINCV